MPQISVKSHIFGGYNHRYYANKLAASASDNHISMENGTIDSHGGSVSMIAGDMENAGSGSSTMTNNTITIPEVPSMLQRMAVPEEISI